MQAPFPGAQLTQQVSSQRGPSTFSRILGALVGGLLGYSSGPSAGGQLLGTGIQTYGAQRQDRKRRAEQGATPSPLFKGLTDLVRPQNVSTKPEPTIKKPQVSTRGNGPYGPWP